MPLGGALAASLPAIASTVSGFVDAGKRKQLEKNLSLLDARQQEDLNKNLAKEQNKQKRMELLTKAVNDIKSAQYTAKMDAESKRQKNLALYVIGGAILLLGAVVVIKKMKK